MNNYQIHFRFEFNIRVQEIIVCLDKLYRVPSIQCSFPMNVLLFKVHFLKHHSSFFFFLNAFQNAIMQSEIFIVIIRSTFSDLNFTNKFNEAVFLYRKRNSSCRFSNLSTKISTAYCNKLSQYTCVKFKKKNLEQIRL